MTQIPDHERIASNFYKVILPVPGITLYYSYSTAIGFYTRETGRVVCCNIWGDTTGKHLNLLGEDHSKRLSRADFIRVLEKYFQK
jgi:hypothetical protein